MPNALLAVVAGVAAAMEGREVVGGAKVGAIQQQIPARLRNGDVLPVRFEIESDGGVISEGGQGALRGIEHVLKTLVDRSYLH